MAPPKQLRKDRAGAQRAARLRVVDLRLSDGNGLDVIEASPIATRRARRGAHRLWQHRNAVTAVKLGAIDYLAKPADAEPSMGAHGWRFAQRAS